MRRTNVTASDIAFFVRLTTLVLGLGFLVGLISPAESLAQTPAAPVARAVSVQGTVEARRAGQTAWQPVKLNDTFSPGDAIRVLDRSRADIAMLDQSVLRLNANTEITIEPVKDQRTGVVSLLRGATHFFSRGPRSLEVQTPFTVAGVRGTEFYIGLEPDRALLTVFEGTVLAQSPAGSLTVTSGQSAVAETGKAPVARVVARPRDAVQWTLYYPPVLYFRPDEFPAGPDWQGMTRQSIEAYLKGDIAGAFDAIATVPATVADPRFFAYRAHLLLAVGRVDEAAADIERALRIAPDDANALALQTIIAVAQGDRDRALATAQRAVLAAPTSAAAHLALSYAQQAQFDLEGARKSVENAVAADSKNALAWARLSELWASFGELGQAQRAAERAATLEPNLSRTQTVLGYAYLMRIKTKHAKEAFERAIVLDQADPLPRLGLGLAKIREGKLHDGGREVEVAASLDPNNAIVRSYLGKTYYEEKRTGLAEREYEMAKQLDPNDPTPYFYDAIAKQTSNRPVEALQDLQRAIELNDNRAVYRSRLLLDEDLAARSAAQARIYNDLGFQQRALVEGWKAVNTDPTNFSAHRFLADSYAVLPRHEIARVSELLQSQLLQPLNMTPIQPQLAEANLFLISAGGPGALSFNEFNPIFNRDGVTFQASGLAGGNSTYGGEAVLAGIYKNLSFSLGGFTFSTDGWRNNASQEDHIANAFVQLAVTRQLSLQAEFRYRDRTQGDIQQRFFDEDFFPGLQDEVETYTYRVGGRYAFSPSSILLGSVIYTKSDETLKDEEPPLFSDFPGSSLTFKGPPSKAISAELQHLFRSRYVNLTTGVGYANVTSEFDTVAIVNIPPPFQIPVDTAHRSGEHVNAYLYAYISPLRNLTFTLGASYDYLNGDPLFVPGEDEGQFNPKAGVIWNPFPDTTIRAAVFRVLKRTLIAEQTLEPTQVAGFNQFFDDANATESWRYGGAVDQRFTKNIFGGVEYSRRELTVPFVVGASEADEFDAAERLARAYLYWTPHRSLALRSEYIFERFKNDIVTGEQPVKLETHRIPLGISFFDPSGFGASLTGTYWNQTGRFLRTATGFVEPGHEDFWTVDVGLRYRLPQRYGFVAIGVTNLLDREFQFFNTDFNNPFIQPDRTFFAKVTLALP